MYATRGSDVAMAKYRRDLDRGQFTACLERKRDPNLRETVARELEWVLLDLEGPLSPKITFSFCVIFRNITFSKMRSMGVSIDGKLRDRCAIWDLLLPQKLFKG
jgi:hypothetical protein